MTSAAHRSAIRRIASHFAFRRHRSYVRGKLRWDPVFERAASLLADSPRPLLDVGCGFGLLGQYLRERGFLGSYLGIDFDAGKIEQARAAAAHGNLDLRFATGSADALPAFRGDVALIDLLHYLPASAQREVLNAAADRCTAGGLVIVRNVIREANWRFRWTLVEESAARAIGWIRSPTRHFPSCKEIESPLEASGLATEVSPLWGRTPFNSYLVVARAANA